MARYLYLIFFIDFALLVWIVFLYMRSLDRVVSIATAKGAIDSLRSISGNPSRLSLMSDFRFAISLFTKSYKKHVFEGPLLHELDRASKYLYMQYPLALIAFFIPILSRFLSN